jgi:integrase
MTEIVPVAVTAVALPDEPLPPALLPADENPYRVYIASLRSAQSRRTMTGCLDRIAALLGHQTGETVPWGQLRYKHTAAIAARLGEQTSPDADGNAIPWSPSSVNKHLSALRQVMETAWMLGQMTAEDYHRARKVKNLKGTRRRKAGRHIGEQEMIALLNTCTADKRLIGRRDAAIFSLLHSTGMRREEVATARRRDYEPGDRRLTIIGKGEKSREVYLHEAAAHHLGRWLADTPGIRGTLFVPIDRWENTAPKAMTTDALAKALDRRRIEAGLPYMTLHDFRRTFAGNLLDAGVDVVTVQELMGHASPVTTAEYDHRPGRRRKEAIDSSLSLPIPKQEGTDQ